MSKSIKPRWSPPTHQREAEKPHWTQTLLCALAILLCGLWVVTLGWINYAAQHGSALTLLLAISCSLLTMLLTIYVGRKTDLLW
jgi:hypothetical protein